MPATQNMFEALCQVADQLPDKRGYGENTNLRDAAYYIAAELVRPLDKDTRADWLGKLFDSNFELDLPVRLVSSLNRKRQDGAIDLEVNSDAAQQLAAKAIARIRRACSDGSIWGSPWIGPDLLFWAKTETSKPVGEWLTQDVTSEEKAIKLALSFVTILTSGRNEYPRLWAAQLDELTDINRLADLTEGPGMGDRRNSRREWDAVLMLRQARNLKKPGKPYKEVKLRETDP